MDKVEDLNSEQVQDQINLIHKLTWDRSLNFILLAGKEEVKEAYRAMLNNHNSDQEDTINNTNNIPTRLYENTLLC